MVVFGLKRRNDRRGQQRHGPEQQAVHTRNAVMDVPGLPVTDQRPNQIGEYFRRQKPENHVFDSALSAAALTY